MTQSVSVREVGLRDGLQLITTVISTEIKGTWCAAQAAAGFGEIEVTSFVPPSVIPQFSDAPQVLADALKIDGLLATTLVPNLKGAIRAMACGAQKITFVLSASEEHNMANVRCTTDESLAMFAAIIDERRSRGMTDGTQISAAIATSFGCSIQGAVPQKRVVDIAAQLVAAGADEINIADTVGYANPAQVRRLIVDVQSVTGAVPVATHFHDTRGMGLANVTAAADVGIRRFDASLGGLGGCPFAPGASGNIATEDCIYLLESLGLDTGIELPALLDVRAKLEHWLEGETLEGRLLKAGPAKTFMPAR